MDFALHAPFNSLSLGQVSINITKECFKRDLKPYIFSIGEDNFEAFKLSDEFKLWFNSCKDKALKSYKRDIPVLKIWHLLGSIESYGIKQILYSFHEPDQMTDVEVNIINNNSKVIFPSKYSVEVAKTFGCENVDNIPLGFDSDSFHIIKDRQYVDSGVIQFGLCGKAEKRKQTFRVIGLWAKKYGNNPKYKLNCAIFNPFLPIEVQNNLLIQALEGKNYFNINFVPYMQGNDALNDYFNSNGIIIDMSSAEAWSLPSFQSVCLGKHAVVLRATGMLEWATPENAILVNPTSKVLLHDGVFFRDGYVVNQGSGFEWTDQSFYEGIEKAIQRYEKNPINQAGIELSKRFTWKNTVDLLLKNT